MRIGVFDSGLGGIATLKDLIKYKPNNEYIYFGDTINLPYGEKTKEELKDYADKIYHLIIENVLKNNKVTFENSNSAKSSAEIFFTSISSQLIPIFTPHLSIPVFFEFPIFSSFLTVFPFSKYI